MVRYACSCNKLVTYLLLADWIYSFFPQSAPSLFLKSNFEYLRGNYRKAVKLLNSSNIAEHPGPLKTGTLLKTTHICFKNKNNGSPFQSEHISFFVFMWDLYTIIIYIFDSGNKHAKYTLDMSNKGLLKNVVMKNEVFLSWNIFTQVCLFFLLKGECMRCMFWNNLGCIHFAMGKHNLGLFYFKKALQENDHICAQLGDGSNGQGKRNEDLLHARIYDRPYFSVW